MTGPFQDALNPFPSSYADILERIAAIDPVKYGHTRNFIDGAVSYLSPYISRGVISTKFVFDQVLKQGHKLSTVEKFIQELAWRDYWQQVWISKGDLINNDLKKPQDPIANFGMPWAIMEAATGVEAIDRNIRALYETGYMHNHLRMYVASLACNLGRSHWKYPAQWMYYHLLDADWASNALSWQWVAGANSHKKYYANQDNINKYGRTQQQGTFLDVDYGALGEMPIPEVLTESVKPDLETPLPSKITIDIDPDLPTLLYNFYNLDPEWKTDMTANRVVLLEPAYFRTYPVSQKTIDFVLALSQNLENPQIFVGGFDELLREYQIDRIYYKEHPLNKHYTGNEESRDWMFDVQGYYPSFFGFWKKCKKQLNN